MCLKRQRSHRDCVLSISSRGSAAFTWHFETLVIERVFASEIDEELASLYKRNFDLQPCGDIRELDIPRYLAMTWYALVSLASPFRRLGSNTAWNAHNGET